MPFYTYECPSGHQTVLIRTVSDRAASHSCMWPAEPCSDAEPAPAGHTHNMCGQEARLVPSVPGHPPRIT